MISVAAFFQMGFISYRKSFTVEGSIHGYPDGAYDFEEINVKGGDIYARADGLLPVLSQ